MMAKSDRELLDTLQRRNDELATLVEIGPKWAKTPSS